MRLYPSAFESYRVDGQTDSVFYLATAQPINAKIRKSIVLCRHTTGTCSPCQKSGTAKSAAPAFLQHFFDWRGPKCGAGSPVGECLPGSNQRTDCEGEPVPTCKGTSFVRNSVSLFTNPFTKGSLEHNLGYIPSR